MTNILDLGALPKDPIEQIIWLDGVLDAVHTQLEPAWAAAYGQARLTGRMDEAERIGPFSHKRAMALTRAWNEKNGRLIRWGDRRG